VEGGIKGGRSRMASRTEGTWDGDMSPSLVTPPGVSRMVAHKSNVPFAMWINEYIGCVSGMSS
jgi:hypothetical protein